MSYKSLLIWRVPDGSYSVQADTTRYAAESWTELQMLLDRLEHEELDEENIL